MQTKVFLRTNKYILKITLEILNLTMYNDSQRVRISNGANLLTCSVLFK